jgi:hypothetical protein
VAEGYAITPSEPQPHMGTAHGLNPVLRYQWAFAQT